MLAGALGFGFAISASAGLPPNIWLEGGSNYLGHVQGVCTDGTNLWWSMTFDLVRTDLSGRILERYSDRSEHMGDLCVHGGRLYVGVNRKAKAGARRGDQVWVFDSKSLRRQKVVETPQTIWCNNGIEWSDDRFWIITNAPVFSEYNYVYEFLEDFRFVQCRPIASGWTNLGVQTICRWGGKMLLGCYGTAKGVPGAHENAILVVDRRELTRPSGNNFETPSIVPIEARVRKSGGGGMLFLDGYLWIGRCVTRKLPESEWKTHPNGLVERARFGAFISRERDFEKCYDKASNEWKERGSTK